jgi:hypothetical protein
MDDCVCLYGAQAEIIFCGERCLKHIDLRRLCENCTVAMTGDGPIDRRLIRVQRSGESQFLHH